MTNNKTDFSKEEKLIDLCIDYGIDLENRIINFTGDLEEGYFSIFDFAMTRLEQSSRKAITFKINTCGGDTYECFALVARLKESPCQIITKAYGKCMSSGFVLLASGDKRLMSKYCQAMHHSVQYGLIKESHPNAKLFVEQAEKEEIIRLKYLESVSNISLTKWKKLTTNSDKYLTADECLKIGIVDQLF